LILKKIILRTCPKIRQKYSLFLFSLKDVLQ